MNVRPQTRLFVPWIILATICTLAMYVLPGQETVPYHLAWIGVALAYGIEPWPVRPAVVAVAVFTLATGAVLVVRASEGVIAWGETSEIPMMSLLMLLVIWNVRRRHVAFASLTAMASRDRAQALQRERLSRMTSHEMRNPATIANGYAEVLLAEETDPGKREDLEVIRDELGRLVMASDRLVRMIRLQDQVHLEQVDLAALLADIAERWTVVADRDWQVSADAGTHLCSADRIRACLDTLVENAVRYTEPGDAVRLVARRHGDQMLIGVADGGPGMVASDPKSQTGLGLALVHESAAFRGGRVVTGRAAEGGALVLMAVPVGPAAPVVGPKSALPTEIPELVGTA